MSTKPLPILSFGDVLPVRDSAMPPFPCVSLDDEDPAAVVDPSQLSLHSIAHQVNKAKKIAVVCGAGISCASGIPDFRSSDGLFESLKKQYPEARLNSGRDLFDASLFQSEQNASIFFTMIAELKRMADRASPTSFHRFLKMLDDQGKLFRVYTQNIDALEEKAGLSYGLGDMNLPLPPRRAPRSPTKPAAAKSRSSASTAYGGQLAGETSSQKSSTTGLPYPSPAPSPPWDSTPAATHASIPKCIPLHGHLNTMSCAHCSTTEPIAPYLSDLEAGQAISCPTCRTVDERRASKGERSRGVGKLRPDVVLYGEAHKDGERVGEITRRDLMGARPDLLLVVGTSLKVPGTKRLVRELSKVIKPAPKPAEDDDDGEADELAMPSASAQSAVSTASSTATSRETAKRRRRPPPVHVIYLNYEFPKPSSEWKDVFDVWLRGDVQEFVELVEREKADEERKAEARRLDKLVRERKKAEVALLKQTQSQDVKVGAPASRVTVPPKNKSRGGAASLRTSATVANKTDDTKLKAKAASAKSRRAAARLSMSLKSGGLPPLPELPVPVTAPVEASPRVTRQQTKLSFNVTKSSVARVTGTKR